MPDTRQKCMSTVLFRVRNLPAVLYKALGGFATNKVNLTRIESYMIEGQFENTQFLIDAAAHCQDPAFELALEELAHFATETTVLGCYPAHPHREVARRGAQSTAQRDAVSV
ncbi:hypothetical protein [Roseibium sp. Sym1]|uniref:hypothetical protein n=1 Tax=Roseibium sp. Sym1 TaxID=3016006 RepID=UPI0022B46274|nr:hypothetical protein [Roseibium sp. Sym1]